MRNEEEEEEVDESSWVKVEVAFLSLGGWSIPNGRRKRAQIGADSIGTSRLSGSVECKVQAGQAAETLESSAAPHIVPRLEYWMMPWLCWIGPWSIPDPVQGEASPQPDSPMRVTLTPSQRGERERERH